MVISPSKGTAYHLLTAQKDTGKILVYKIVDMNQDGE